ncbi:trypsin-like serine peptidase [Elusimicrobiota bacterium]
MLKSKHTGRFIILSILFATPLVYAIADLYQVMQILTLAQISVIFEEDDRLDLYRVKNPDLLKLADSTVALFLAQNVEIDHRKNIARLKTNNFGKKFNMCKGEPFRDQPTGAFCSGSLVGPDIVLTAGHCVEDEPQCANTKFVFGFGVRKKGRYPVIVPEDDVYECENIIERSKDKWLGDWALIRLKRQVDGRKPLKLNFFKSIAKNTPLIIIGHPSGLPTKIAGNAKVVDPMPGQECFSANLDSYKGNSGSPVFNANNLLIEGVLARRGELDLWGDFEEKGNCNVSRRVELNEDDIFDSKERASPGKTGKSEIISHFLLPALDPAYPSITKDELIRARYADTFISSMEGMLKTVDSTAVDCESSRMLFIEDLLGGAHKYAARLGPEYIAKVDAKAKEIENKCGKFEYPKDTNWVK